MTAETDLSRLLATLSPELNPQEYVFATFADARYGDHSELQPLAAMHEEEGTLKVHSSLAAVGLTAAFSSMLTDHKISANVIAGFYHDHIFVPPERADDAMQALRSLSEKA